jgi:hypothetical protein
VQEEDEAGGCKRRSGWQTPLILSLVFVSFIRLLICVEVEVVVVVVVVVFMIKRILS